MELVRSIRLVGFIFIAGLVAAVWVTMAPATSEDAPTLPSATQYETLIQQALDDNEANDARTESAPQQQVVNGWVTRDLLTIIAKANADQLRATGAVIESNGVLRTNPFDERVPALLALGVLALVWDGITRPATAARTVLGAPTVVANA